MPNSHVALDLIGTYGYLGLLAAVFVGALGIGVPIPITALLLTLGALSGSRGGPNLPLVAVCGVAGIVAGHLVDYSGGRLGNRLLQRWLARLRPDGGVGGLLNGALRLRGGFAGLVFLSRFLLTSIASPVSLLAGTMKMALGFYLALEVTGEAIYVLGNLTLGRVFGAGLLANGGVPAAFWIGVGVLSLMPLLFLRLAMLMLARRRSGLDVSGTAAPTGTGS